MLNLAQSPDFAQQVYQHVQFDNPQLEDQVRDGALYSTEHQVLALPDPQRLLGFAALKVGESGLPETIAVNQPENVLADVALHTPKGVDLYNTVQLLYGRNRWLMARRQIGLYAWEAPDDQLHGTPYQPSDIVKELMRRRPESTNGTHLHGIPLHYTARWVGAMIRDMDRVGERSPEHRSASPLRGIPVMPPLNPRRLTVYSGTLHRLGTVDGWQE